MSPQTNALIASLPLMASNDLKIIQKAIDSLLPQNMTKTNTEVECGTFERLVFDAVQVELDSHGFSSFINYSAFTKTRQFSNWKRSIPILEAFIKKHFSKHIKNEVEQRALLRIIIKAIIQNLDNRELPISLGTIALNLHRAPQVFDDSFPGYIKSGLAHMIILAMRRGRKSK